jgi:hypothetical protein
MENFINEFVNRLTHMIHELEERAVKIIQTKAQKKWGMCVCVCRLRTRTEHLNTVHLKLESQEGKMSIKIFERNIPPPSVSSWHLCWKSVASNLRVYLGVLYSLPCIYVSVLLYHIYAVFSYCCFMVYFEVK